MNHFYVKVTPILAVVNFLCSSMILNILLSVIDIGIDYTEILVITFLVLAILTINLVVVIKKKNKDVGGFSIIGYVIFVLVLPCVVPLVLELIIIAFNWIMNSMELYYSIV